MNKLLLIMRVCRKADNGGVRSAAQLSLAVPWRGSRDEFCDAVRRSAGGCQLGGSDWILWRRHVVTRGKTPRELNFADTVGFSREAARSGRHSLNFGGNVHSVGTLTLTGLLKNTIPNIPKYTEMPT